MYILEKSKQIRLEKQSSQTANEVSLVLIFTESVHILSKRI